MSPAVRQIAYRVRIGDMLKGNMIMNGDRFSALEVKDRKVSRVNLICAVVDRYSNPAKNYNSLTVDDGTGQIQIKGFVDTYSLLQGIEIGDTIRIIGVLRFFNDEIYILPEVVKKIDPKWAHVRRLEMAKEFGEFEEKTDEFNPKTDEVDEEIVDVIEKEKIEDIQEGAKSIILKKIKESADGMDVEKLIMEINLSVDEINSSIASLIADGEIYEPRPGHLRSLD